MSNFVFTIWFDLNGDEPFDYSNFISKFRDFFIDEDDGDNIHGIPYMRESAYKFVDVRLYFDDVHFVVFRFNTKDVYVVAFARGEGRENVTYKDKTWYQMRDDSDEPVDALLEREEKNHWKRVTLVFKNSYKKLKSVSDTKISGTCVSRSQMKKLAEYLYKCNPKDKSTTSEVAEKCKIACLGIAEPVRFKVLHDRIAESFNDRNGYEFDLGDAEIVINWGSLATFMEEDEQPLPSPADIKSWNDGAARGDADCKEKLDAWNTRELWRKRLEENYGIVQPAGAAFKACFVQFCWLLKMSKERKKAKKEEAAKSIKARKKQGKCVGKSSNPKKKRG